MNDSLLKQPENKHEILTKFKLRKIIMEKNMWKIVIDLDEYVSKLYMTYSAEFIPDESGFKNSIEEIGNQIVLVRNNPQMDLLDEAKNAEIEKLENSIHLVEKNRLEFLANNPQIETTMSTVEFKNKDIVTVTFKISPNIIEFLNAKRFNLSDNYLLKLSRLKGLTKQNENS